MRKLHDGRCLSESLVLGGLVEDVVAPKGRVAPAVNLFGSEEGLDETKLWSAAGGNGSMHTKAVDGLWSVVRPLTFEEGC